MIYYRQCKLKKGDTISVAWIPEKFAKRGKWLKIKDEDGWQVIDIYGRAREDYVLTHSQDYKHQREASDI